MQLWRQIWRSLSGTAEVIASKAERHVATALRRHAGSLVHGSVLVLVLAGFLVIPWYHWNALVEWSEMSNGELSRNLALTCVAALAFVLAFWRSSVASRLAAQGDERLRNERYQRGAEMLGSSALAPRLGGVYALERLAQEHPERYYKQAQDLLCAFVRHPTVDSKIDHSGKAVATVGTGAEKLVPSCRDDVQVAVSAMAAGRDKVRDGRHEFKPNLSNAKLQYAVLRKANLSNSELYFADLSRAQLWRADLSGADLSYCDLSSAMLGEADLSGANLYQAKLAQAILYGVKGLTQSQLDGAAVTTGQEDVPKLVQSRCAETGNPLAWSRVSASDLSGD